MAVLTISREQLVNGARTMGAAGAIGGGIASFACALFNQNCIYPCTVMVLSASTWVIISVGGCTQKTVSEDESTTEETNAAKQVIKDAVAKRVDKAGEALKKGLQSKTAALVDLTVASVQTGLATSFPGLGGSLGSAIGSAGESSKGLSNMGINSSVDLGAKSLKSSTFRSIDYSADISSGT